jgi:hypothetical protein
MVFAVTTFLALAAMSVGAHRALPAAEKLPMQWAVDGRVTWYAPRALALTFLPVLSIVTLVAVSLWAGEEDIHIGLWVASVSFVLGHALYLWLTWRHLR